MSIKGVKQVGVFSQFKSDFPAGIVVFLVALPLCLGISLASGAPPIAGVLAGIIGGIVVGLISGSAIGVSGPAAGLAAIVYGYLQQYDYDFFLLAVILSGVIQLILGYLRAGVIGDYFPSAVIKGMLAAIGIILILKQIPHGVGYDADIEGEMEFIQRDGHNTFSEIFYSFNYMSWGAVIITVVSLGILILWQNEKIRSNKILNLIPSPLIVVVFGIVMNKIYALTSPGLVLQQSHLVNIPIPKDIIDFAKSLTHPDFNLVPNLSIDQIKKLTVIALTIAVVGSLETLLSVEATDKIDPHKRITPPDLELKAQGVGNIISGLVGGLPITQVIVRSTANVTAGGKTKLSAIFHGFLLLTSIILIPALLNQIPLACLAAILFMIGYKLASIKLFKEMFKSHYRVYIPFVITVLAILFSNLLVGIMIGLIVAIFFILQTNRQNEPFDVEIKKSSEEGKVYDVIISLNEEVTYLSKHIIQRSLLDIPENCTIYIDGRNSGFISQDVIETIHDYIENVAVLKNITVDFDEHKFNVKDLDSKALNHLNSL